MIRHFGGRKAARGFNSVAVQLTSVLTHASLLIIEAFMAVVIFNNGALSHYLLLGRVMTICFPTRAGNKPTAIRKMVLLRLYIFIGCIESK